MPSTASSQLFATLLLAACEQTVRPPLVAAPAARTMVAAPVVPSSVAPAMKPARNVLDISLSPCARTSGSITLHFSHAMVRAGRLEKGRVPNVAFDPPLLGSFRWSSPQDLVFSPRRSTMPWGHPITVTVEKARALGGKPVLTKAWTGVVTSPLFEMAGKVATSPVEKGSPRFVAFLGGELNAIGAGPLFLLYDQPVDPKALRPHFALVVGDTSIELRVARPAGAAQVFDGRLKSSHIVAVSATLPAGAESVLLTYPMKVGEAIATDSIALKVQRQFTMIRAALDEGNAENAPLSAVWTLQFSHPLTARQLDTLLTITPRPAARHISVDGNTARIQLRLAPGVEYRMTVGRQVRDVLGNRLDRRHVVRFRAQDLPPSLRLAGHHVTLARNTARLPVRVRNTGVLHVRTYVVPSEDAFAKAVTDGVEPECADFQRKGLLPAPKEVPTSGALNQELAVDVPAESRTGGSLLCVEVVARGRGSQAGKQLVRASALVQLEDVVEPRS